MVPECSEQVSSPYFKKECCYEMLRPLDILLDILLVGITSLDFCFWDHETMSHDLNPLRKSIFLFQSLSLSLSLSCFLPPLLCISPWVPDSTDSISLYVTSVRYIDTKMESFSAPKKTFKQRVKTWYLVS